MIRLSACIDMLWRTEYADIADRIAPAKRAGYDAIEFWGWNNKNLDAIGEAMQKTGMPLAAMCVSTADDARGDAWKAGAMLRCENAGVYEEMVEESCEKAKLLGTKTLISTVGQDRIDMPAAEKQENVVLCLKRGAKVAEKHGITIVVEPLNILVNHMGYYLPTSKQAFEILEAVNSPAVALLYDVYHQQITEGFLIPTITKNIGKIGHFHIADVPGRHEPGSGEINYCNVLKAIDALPYEGYVGCEYTPSEGRTAAETALDVMRIAGKA